MKAWLTIFLLCCGHVVFTQDLPREGRQAGIRDHGLKPYLRLSKPLPHVEDKPWRLVGSLPYNMHFQPSILVEGKKGDTISLNSTNPLVRYLTPTETFTMTLAHQTYEAKNWVSGEGAMYTIPPGVKVLSVAYRETGFDTRIAGFFTCNDEDYNILWRKGARTAYLCMRDHFYDCPDRERVGFWGDGTPELNQCFLAFDSNAHRLARELVQRPLDPEFYPGQQLEFLGEYGLWYYYMQTGDLASIKSVYPATKNFLFQVYKPGKKTQWFDWGKENKDVAVMEACFLYIDLGSLRKMAMVTGHAEDTAVIDAKRDSIRTGFHEKYWHDGAYRSEQVAEPDDRANAMAVNAGLAAPATWESIYRNVLSVKTYSSCFFDRWVFEALCRMGKQEQALLRMEERYRTMIPASFSTLWEHYDRWWASHIDAFDEGSSLNHGWNPPVINLSQDICGIAPVKAGWDMFQVLPKEAFLRRVSVVIPSVKGDVSMSLDKSAGQYALHLRSPAATKAIVGIPRGSFSRLDAIRVNGQLIWEGMYKEGAKGVYWEGEDPEYVKFLVDPGQWDFIATGSVIMTSPKAEGKPLSLGTALDKMGWKASASVRDSVFLFSGDSIPIDVSAENAIDGDHWTGWRDMTRTQYPGQSLSVDMGVMQSFNRVVLDNTWALWDSPKRYVVAVSNEGRNWKEVASGEGKLGMTIMDFPNQSARYLKVTQAGSDSTYHWSVYEIDVYRK
jgi:alpha-L-rhamnosidase